MQDSSTIIYEGNWKDIFSLRHKSGKLIFYIGKHSNSNNIEKLIFLTLKPANW